MIARLLRNGLRAGPQRYPGSSFSFTMGGLFCGIAFSLLTVYLGDNTVPILFTLLGLAEGYLLQGGDMGQDANPIAHSVVAPTRFQIVLA